MQKTIAFVALLLVCSMGYATSLVRMVNQYKEKQGAVYYVLNRDYHFNDASEGVDIAPMTQQLVSGVLAAMGIEEVVALRLDSCAEDVKEHFTDHVYDAVPDDYTLVSDKDMRRTYVSNTDSAYAYIMVVDEERPGLILSYVTNSFVRAIMNDEGTGIDKDKLERYMNRLLEGLEEVLQESGERIKKGLQRLEKYIKEHVDEWEDNSLEA